MGESMADTHRGHPIQLDPASGQWRFADDGTLVSKHWTERPCGHCLLPNTPEGHDGCLGTIPGVVNACCGHGVAADAYVQYEDGRRVQGNHRGAVPETTAVGLETEVKL